MKVILSNAAIIKQMPGIEGIYRQIEIAGRTCYKSENNMTDDSAAAFVQRMINSNHTAMLEHGTVYLDISESSPRSMSLLNIFNDNNYSIVCEYTDDELNVHYAVTTNYRVIVENFNDDIDYVMSFICKPTKYHEPRITIKFIVDRGVSHELVRHRVFSFAQESTRYCNYSKDKFGNELTFVAPWYANIDDPKYEAIKEDFMIACRHAEKSYFKMLNDKATPQDARAVLPNAVKTEIVMTGFRCDWQHFIELRSDGTTGAPHPDMKIVADIVKKKLKL